MSAKAYIGVDFDGVLAKSLDQYREGDIGAPIWRMINRVKHWIAEGKTVKIITARGGNPYDVAAIHYFLHEVGLPELEVTNIKHQGLVTLWDDRAVAVEPDTGKMAGIDERVSQQGALYMGPSDIDLSHIAGEGARCGKCAMFNPLTGNCFITIPPSCNGQHGVCGLFIGGKQFSVGLDPLQLIDKETVGYIEHAPTRCGGCEYFNGVDGCAKVEGKIDKDGCCNLWEGLEKPNNTTKTLSAPDSFGRSLLIFSDEPTSLFDGEAFSSIVIVFGDSKVALVGRDDEKKYMLPAGHVDKGETSVQAASRELREETGLDIAPDQLIFIGASLRKSKEENNSFFATQLMDTPDLKPGSDVDEAFWQDVWDLPKLKFDPVNALLRARKVLSTYPNDRGLLIAFEGIDGSGKSTQVRLLGEFLAKRGIAYTVSKWNSAAYISDLIGELKGARKLSPSLFFLLHAADMMARYENEILPALCRNEIVLCDRYYYTGLVRDAIRGIDPKLNTELYARLRKPDVLFYCKSGSQVAVSRLDRDRLGFYNTGMDVGGFGHDKQESAVGYEKEMDRLYQEFMPEDTITLDATLKISTVQNAVMEHIQDRILTMYEISEEEPVLSIKD